MLSVTREEAQRAAQEKLVEAARALQAAMALADEHKFVLDLREGDLDYNLPHDLPYDHYYFPKGITADQAQGHEPWCGVYAGFYEENYGQWVSSSNVGDC